MLFYYTITFDLPGAGWDAYEIIYEWAHHIGGYRYVRLSDGTWGRLPSTVIVVASRRMLPTLVRDDFQAQLRFWRLEATHISVTSGLPAVLAEPIASLLVPSYATQNESVRLAS